LEGGQLRGEIPGQQFLDAIDRVFRQSLEHLAQIGLDVQSVELRASGDGPSANKSRLAAY
jgi:hypothetical protein